MGPTPNLANEALLLYLAPELTKSRLEFLGVFDNDSQVRFTSFSPLISPGGRQGIAEGYGLGVAEGGERIGINLDPIGLQTTAGVQPSIG